MGRFNEANRLEHKKKLDQQKNRVKVAKASRKEKLKEIISKFNSEAK